MDHLPSSHLKENSVKRFRPTKKARLVPIRLQPPVQRGCILGKHRIPRSSTPCTWRKAGHISRALVPKTLTNHDAATFCCLLPLRRSYFLHWRVLHPESNGVCAGLATGLPHCTEAGSPPCALRMRTYERSAMQGCSLQHLIYFIADVW